MLRNLRIALHGEGDRAWIEELAKKAFRRSGANLISSLRAARLSRSGLEKVLRLENFELLEAALEKGGVVLLLAHMGNWELLSRLVHFFPEGTKTGAFYRPLNNPLMDQRILAQREADGTRMFSKRDNPLHVATFLREGGIVGILADQRVGQRGPAVEFFGRKTRVSPLPALLAKRSKSTVLALSLVTEEPGKWKATLVPVSQPQDSTNCMRALEKAMKTSPMDVFWLQERWKPYISTNHALDLWLGSQTRGEKQHRALVRISIGSEGWFPPEKWKHPDVVYEIACPSGKLPEGWLPDDTRVHYLEPNNDLNSLRKALQTIDHSAALPLDFVLTGVATPEFVEACRIEAIPLIQFQ